MRLLLDKVVARRILLGLLALSRDRELASADRVALDFFQRCTPPDHQLYIVPPTANVVRRINQMAYRPIVEFFLGQVEVIQPARYALRWARRLRESDFSREDAAVLALGTFGTDDQATMLGVHFLATQDQRLINNWNAHSEQIQARLTAMQHDLPSPYHAAGLPRVLPPEWIPVG